MDALIKAVQKLYENSTKIRFMSDENGNILWKSGNGIDEKTSIIFPNGVPYNKDEEKYDTVLINGQEYAVSGSVLSTQNKGAILWSVLSLTEVLKELGSTDTYTETCYMISEAKRNVESILKQNEDITTDNQEICDNERIRRQNKACYSLMRQIECFQELTTVIYKRSVNNTTINLVDFMKEVVEESNLMLNSPSTSLLLTHKGIDYNNAVIKANKYYLFLCMMTIIRKLLECSTDQIRTIRIKREGEHFTIIFPFDHDMTHYIDKLNSDISMFCTKMYIGYLGGSIKEHNNQMHVNIPIHKVTAFHSTRAEYNYKPGQYKKLATFFLSDCNDEK